MPGDEDRDEARASAKPGWQSFLTREEAEEVAAADELLRATREALDAGASTSTLPLREILQSAKRRGVLVDLAAIRAGEVPSSPLSLLDQD